MAWFDEFNLPGATIDGYFGFINADGPDGDEYPDVVLASGTVTFTATTEAARIDGAWLGIQPVTAQIFEGKIVVSEEDPRPVRLLATDAPIGVADWAWTATFDLTGFTLAPLTFKAPRDTTVNLTADMIPIKSQPYQIIEGASIVDTEVDTAGERMRFEMSDGTYTRWVDVPNGEKGDPGAPGEKGDPGKDGQSPTIAMGAVSAGTAADAWLTGTPLARELNLTLPRGPKGEKGDGSSWAEMTGKPSSFPSSVPDVSGLDTALAGKRGVEATVLGIEDLDTVATPGNYYQRTTSNATLDRHYPVAAPGPLTVYASADRSQIQQEYIRFSTTAGERYWRTKAGTSWSPWWRILEATDPRLSDARTPTAHTHDERYYTKLQTDDRLALRARTVHTHELSDVNGLQGALDAKADAAHTHPTSDIAGLGSELDSRFANLSNAYDVAVSEGFSGTTQEWLDSLVGAKGEEGPYGGTSVTDPQVASWVADIGTATRANLDGLYAAQRSVTVNIPTDYPTLQSAIDALSARYATPGASIVLNIEAGHQPATGITVTNGDWSRFIIKSTDAEVAVADSFVGDFVRATQARAPRLGTVIDMRDLGGDGYAMWRSSVGHVEQWCGIKNAAGRGLYVTDNSSCFALRSVFTGSGDRNAWITRASTLDAELSDFSANKGGENAIYVSRASRANLETCNITNAFQNALTVTRSFVAANHCDMSGAGLRGIVTDSEVYARDCTIANVATEAISADQAAKVTFRDSVISGSGTYGVLSSGSSVVELNGTTVTGSGTKDLGVIRAGVINAHGAKTTLSTGTTPDVANTNVSSLNSQSSQGVIWG